MAPVRKDDKRPRKRPAWSRAVYEGECFVYVAVEAEGWPRYLKIGIARDCDKRLNARTDNPRDVRLHGSVSFATRDKARTMEAYLHNRFAAWSKRAEWFGVGVDDIDAMADAVMACATQALMDGTTLAGKRHTDFLYAVEVNPAASQWWLQREAA